MAISGLVITLREAPELAAEALHWLRDRDRLELGEPPPENPERLPAVLESSCSSSARRQVRALEQHPGVLKVDVIHVGFEESDEQPANPFDRPGRRSVVRGPQS